MRKSKAIENVIVFTAIVALVGAVSALLYKYFNQVKQDGAFVTEEGKKILEDKTKRKQLNNAIDHYKKKGDWGELNKLNIDMS